MIKDEDKYYLQGLKESISTRLIFPENAVAMVVLAHGAGAGIDHQFMYDIQHEIASVNIASFAFNFLYREQNKRTPFRMTQPMTVFEEVWKHISVTYDLPLYVAGKSYGGRVGSMMIDRLPGCKGLIFLGYPFHPPNNIEKLRTEHLYDIALPMLFLQGSRDKLSSSEIVNAFISKANNSTLIWMEDGDHSWKTRKKSGFSQEDHIRSAARYILEFCSE